MHVRVLGAPAHLTDGQPTETCAQVVLRGRSRFDKWVSLLSVANYVSLAPKTGFQLSIWNPSRLQQITNQTRAARAPLQDA